MSNTKKTDLIYTTGLSIDKKRFNNITENINYDKDFSFFLTNGISRIKKATSKIVHMRLSFSEKEGNILDNASYIASKKFEGLITELLGIPFIGNSVKSVLGRVFDIACNEISSGGLDEYKKFQEKHPNQFNKVRLSDKIPFYRNGDFFSLYLSHQSDSCGIAPLSKSNKINLTHIYCDRPYYENEYIDNVILKIDNSHFFGEVRDNEAIQKFFTSIFEVHINDILLSKLIYDLKVADNNIDNDKKVISFTSIKKEIGVSEDDIIKSLSERNFFGIGLLSLTLYSLNNLKEKTEISISHKEKTIQSEFLNELLLMSTDAIDLNISNNIENSKISARIYLSDGITLSSKFKYDSMTEPSKSEDNLNKDKFIESLYGIEHINNEFNNSDIGIFYEKILRPTILPSNENEKKELDTLSEKFTKKPYHELLSKYIVVKDDVTYIKIPIKMMLSLPIGKHGKASSNDFLPSCIYNDQQDIDVLTVGGAEHNRGLAHLINKHRLEFKDKRLFGFMDNYFDFYHKIKIDSDRGSDSSNTYHNFFMGLNQPVAGWNYIFNSRSDDSLGNSINSDVKLIGFRLKNGNKKISILSIYGFSAIASVLGTHLLIAEINGRISINNLFGKRYSDLMDSSRHTHDRGSAATIFFYNDWKSINENRKKIIASIK